MKVLKLPDVLAKTGKKRANLYQMMARGEFPKPIKIGLRQNGWIDSEIDQWFIDRIANRDGKAA